MGRKKNADAPVRAAKVAAPNGGASERRLLKRIQGALSLDLLHPTYKPTEKDWQDACKNQCYVATEAAYHLFGKKAGFVPFVYPHGDGTTHWWLVHQETGAILDPSGPQLKGKTSLYKSGRRATFLTKKPSRRAAELMRRVRSATGK